MKPRTRKAHFTLAVADGDPWRITFEPATKTLRGIRKLQRVVHVISAEHIIRALESVPPIERNGQQLLIPPQ